jgi:hypothetical protein
MSQYHLITVFQDAVFLNKNQLALVGPGEIDIAGKEVIRP